jgi:hypothetical protein
VLLCQVLKGAKWAWLVYCTCDRTGCRRVPNVPGFYMRVTVPAVERCQICLSCTVPGVEEC